MCGIFGAVESRLTKRMLTSAGSALAHRGPDASGMFLDEKAEVGLMHRRLSVVDLQQGDQPLFDLDGNIVLVCNGEIYDYEAIRTELQGEGYTFKTASDSEVIINLYLNHGLGFLSRLRGEFAFLLLDRTAGRLVAARDRFGIKPLYFARTNSGGWCFASEAKAMAAAGLKHLKPDPSAWQRNENYSLFHGVYSVPAATALVLDLSTRRFDTLTYWHPDFPTEDESETNMPPDRASQELDRSLTEAVRLRLRADVPVGVYLSGGIDSAIVAAKAARIQERPPPAFTVSFSDAPDRFDEVEQARWVAEYLGLEHHVLNLDTGTLWGNLEQCLWHNEAPIGDLAPVAKFMLSDLAADHVKVVLTGEGADEVLLGYHVFRRALPGARESGPHDSAARGWRRARKAFGRWLNRTVPSMVAVAKRQGRERADPVIEALPEQSKDSTQLEGRSPVVKMQYRRLKTHLHRRILTAYGDRMEMAHSIEGRVPFLDHHLFETTKRVPVHFKIDREREKIVLRELARKLLPEQITNRTKWRFSTPRPSFDSGCYQALDDLVVRYLSRDAVRRAGLFRWSSVCMLWGLRCLGRFRRHADRSLFNILCLQILHHQFANLIPESDRSIPSQTTAPSAPDGVVGRRSG